MGYKNAYDKEKDKPDAAIGSTYASPNNSKGSDLSEFLRNGPTYTKGAYTPKYQDQANTALKEYLNYGPFEYDVNADKLYQQAVDLYTERGRLASEDAMGQAAALTGGYGNSYAATAGSQAYMQYMQELSAMAPEFEQRAYEKYLQGRSDAYDKYAALQGAEDSNYAKYLDEENANYTRYLNELGAYENAVNAFVQSTKDAYDYEVEMAELNQKLYNQGVENSSAELENYKKVAEIAATYTNREALDAFLENQRAAGTISPTEKDELLLRYGGPEHKKDYKTTDWELVSKGGLNWFGGIDNNAKVKNKYTGEVYRLDDLFEELLDEYDNNEVEARDKVIEIQKALGISRRG